MKDKKNYDNLLAETDEVGQYVKEDNLAEKFETIYNMFVESDMDGFKSHINKLSNNEYTKFIVHLLGEMRIDPRELTRTLQSIVD